MSRAALAALIAASAAAGCGPDSAPPRAQWVLAVGTDAPVPQFGDRLLLEVLDSGRSCDDCRRVFAVGDAETWPVSFGVVAVDGRPPPRVRARLHRAVLTGPDGPTSDKVLDRLVRLPATDAPVEISLALEMRCFGVPSDVDADTTCDPADGQVAATPVLDRPPLDAPPLDGPPLDAPPLEALPAVGSWAPGKKVDCTDPIDDDMACVPGGAFLLGNPLFVPIDSVGLDPTPEQLVQVAPFALDRAEMTVKVMKTLVAMGVKKPGVKGTGLNQYCTYTPTAESDDFPVNCVEYKTAADACRVLGKRLPTEAEWEWAAGNGALESPFPWTDGGDECGHAVVANAPLGFAESGCAASDPLPGAKAGGNPRDVTRNGIKNLGGNVGEWTADVFAPYSDPTCWGPSPDLRKYPHCTHGDSGAFSARGGLWTAAPASAHGYVRNGIKSGAAEPDVGFRCAK